MAAQSRGDGILAQERRLETASDGLGWAKDVVGNLCLDGYGELVDTCTRDGERESYLNPKDHPVGVSLAGPVPQDATCVWNFDDGEGPVRTEQRAVQSGSPAARDAPARPRSPPSTFRSATARRSASPPRSRCAMC